MKRNQSEAKASDSFAALALLPAHKLADIDIARVNLLAAEGLPGAEGLDVDAALAELDRWAEHVRVETDRHLYRFRDAPEEYENSEAYFRMLMLIVVMQADLGVHYNAQRINEPDFTNAKDLFIFGMIGDDNGGTCVSMPVVYVAVGRRLGYPLKLVVTKGHVFARWDDPVSGERFNIEGTNRGLNTFDDKYYQNWPHKLTTAEINNDWFLRSLTPAEAFAVFLMQRGHCLEDTGRLHDAQSAYAMAHRLAPKSPEALQYLANVVRREAIAKAGGTPAVARIQGGGEQETWRREQRPREAGPRGAAAAGATRPADESRRAGGPKWVGLRRCAGWDILTTNNGATHAQRRKVTTMTRSRTLIAFIGLAILAFLAQPAAAHYDTTLGRWLERDPAGYQDGVNLYEYVSARVLVATDAFGLRKRLRVGLRGLGPEWTMGDTNHQQLIGDVLGSKMFNWSQKVEAQRWILGQVDTDGDRRINTSEVADLDLAIHGFSLGAVAAIELTRMLQRGLFGVPVERGALGRKDGWVVCAPIPVKALVTMDAAPAVFTRPGENVQRHINYFQARGGDSTVLPPGAPRGSSPIWTIGTPFSRLVRGLKFTSAINRRVDTRSEWKEDQFEGVRVRLWAGDINHDTLTWYVADEVVRDLQ